MKRTFFFTLFLYLFSIHLFAQTDTVQKVIPGRKNSLAQQKKPYLILISADGFRHDFQEKFNTPNLKRFAKEGVKAESMLPSFPSITFPNHYSIATGLYPSHHGIVHNSFYDRNRNEFYSLGNKKKVEDGSWYGGTPLWVLAEQQQMLSASFFWVGSEANIKGIFPTYYYRYNEKIPIEKRIQTVVNWLKLPEETRPHLITFYLPEVDHEGHEHGPDAEQTRDAVLFVDSTLYKLTEAVKTTGLPVDFIFVSDHGMTTVDTIKTLALPAAIDTSKFIVPRYRDIIVDLYAKDKRYIKPTYKKLKKQEDGFTTYLKTKAPKHLHYSAKDDSLNRMGDIFLVANAPKIFNSSSRKPNPGRHGYDPTKVKDMHAVFYAWGPSFKKGVSLPVFENVDIYPLIVSLLGLELKGKIDGHDHLKMKVLKTAE